MYILAFVFIFFLGTIIGSFLNVVIFRLNTGKSIAKGRSICMTCNRTLRWYELLPVLSFLIQSGRCRRCASRISHQYPIVEFLTGIVFTLISLHFLPIIFFSQPNYVFLVVAYSFIFSLLIVISVYDIRHKIIPDLLVYIFIVLSFGLVFVNHTTIGPLFIVPILANLLSGPVLALPFALLWLVSSGRWMGLGDAKLILGLGWMLGLFFGIASLVLSFWLGSIVGLILMLLFRSKVGMRTEIPFAPFLIVSSFIVFLFNIDIFSIASLFHF
jgi:prepilin signal peptidase PulO-like enzyme (type II secretory pathway)